MISTMRTSTFLCTLVAGLTVAGIMPRAVDGNTNEGDAIIGTWLTSEEEARIEIFKVENEYSGSIVWLDEPLYPADDPEAGKPVRDRKNPDKAKRDQPLLGSTLLSGFEYAGDNSWTNGTIYNAEDGKTYKAKLSLSDDDRLNVRGYIGVPLLGDTTVWARCDASSEA